MITRIHLNTSLESKEERSSINIIKISGKPMIKVISPEGRLEWILTEEQLSELGFKSNTYLQDNGL